MPTNESTLKSNKLISTSFPFDNPIYPDKDLITVVKFSSGLTEAIVALSNDFWLILTPSPVVIKDLKLGNESLTGEAVNIDEVISSINSDKFEEILQKILFRVPELTESEKNKVYASVELPSEKLAIAYYIKLLNKFNLETYLRDFN